FFTIYSTLFYLPSFPTRRSSDLFRQQINENAKMLCWHHVIPEMNHNELVGWTNKNEDLAVVIFRNEDDYYRNKKRIDVNKTVFQDRKSTRLNSSHVKISYAVFCL